MGWARTLFLGDVGNHLDIADNHQSIARLRRDMRANRRQDLDQEQRIELLERENEQQQALIAALARILAAHGVLDAEELRPFVEELDEVADEAEAEVVRKGGGRGSGA